MTHDTRELRAIAERWMGDIWRERKLEVFNDLHAPHFIDGSPAGRGADRESYKQSIAELFAAFPDWEAVVDDLVIDETSGKIAVRWTAAGTHQGIFLGVEATGKLVTFRGIEIVRIENGQLIERWGEWDGIDLLAQLGAFP